MMYSFHIHTYYFMFIHPEINILIELIHTYTLILEGKILL